jgi:chorismate mutase / prephenate dehydratase
VGVDEAVEKLKGFRGSIDSLDSQILDLLNQRAAVALDIGATKRAAGLPVVELSRERAVIEGMGSRNAGPLSNDAIERIYTAIMLEMRRLQE